MPVTSAATFSLTLTAAQVSAIQFAYSVAPDKGLYLTAQDWFAAQISSGVLVQYEARQKAASAGTFCSKFTALSQVQKDSVCSSIGTSAGCNPCQ